MINSLRKVKVTLKDGRKYDAKVIGRDGFSDLAVLQIDATGLKPAKLGTSNGTGIGLENIKKRHTLNNINPPIIEKDNEKQTMDGSYENEKMEDTIFRSCCFLMLHRRISKR